MLIAVTITAVLVVFVSQLINQTALVTTLGNKRIDADCEARSLFERMALDFGHILQRSDVTYYLKTADAPMNGNDLIGFYSTVYGFFPTTPSPISVVAYRVNSDPTNLFACNSLERMGKGLEWNGVSNTNTPLVFLPFTLQTSWPSLASGSAYDDSDIAKRSYEIIGPHVFRLEYYYIEKATGDLVAYPSTWTSLSTIRIKDASAIVVAIAVIDPKAKALLSNSQMRMLLETLPDYSPGGGPGELLVRWQAGLDAIENFPRPVIASIRLYERCFPISDL